MAAPASTALGVPAGIRLEDGYRTALSFALRPTISLWETEMTPIGYDGGEAIDITTMRESLCVIRVPQDLLDVPEFEYPAAYDPVVLSDLRTYLINRNGSITQHFSDGSKADFYGFLRRFIPQGVSRGTMPLANTTVCVSNYDPVNRVEVLPVITSVAGT